MRFFEFITLLKRSHLKVIICGQRRLVSLYHNKKQDEDRWMTVMTWKYLKANFEYRCSSGLHVLPCRGVCCVMR